MAQIFLSYARRDLRRVKPVIKAIEAAGLSVWWDRRLLGGSEFSKEIRSELDRAEAVVALWSANSVQSPWVLDEAGRGRDSGRLVPATLDGTEPPLGFGQLHTVDLSKRRSSEGERPLDELVQAVAAKVGGRRDGPVARPRPRLSMSRPAIAMAAAAIVGALLIGLAVYHFAGSAGSSGQFEGKVAIHSFEAVTDDPQSKLMARLAGESAERIFSTNFIDTAAEWSAPGSAIAAADFALGGTVDTLDDDLRVTADVLDPKTGRTLWSLQVARPANQNRQLADELAVRIADVLRCAIYTKRRMPGYNSPELASRILSYCEAERGGTIDEWRKLNRIGQSIAEIAPKSAQAHAILANERAFFPITNDPQAGFAAVRAEIKKTLALDPNNGAVRWAMGIITDPSVTLAQRERYFRDGLRLDPDFLWNRNALANLMLKVGRIEEGGELFQQFVTDYPLDYVQRGKYAYQLAQQGDLEKAREQFRKVREIWDGPNAGTDFIIEAEMQWGDIAHLRPWLELSEIRPEDKRCVVFIANAREHGALPGADAIREACRSGGPLLRGLALFGHADAALDGLDRSIEDYAPPGQFGPDWIYERGFESLRQDPRLIRILAKVGIPQYWLETGKFPDFCTTEKLPYDCRTIARAAVGAASRQPQPAGNLD